MVNFNYYVRWNFFGFCVWFYEVMRCRNVDRYDFIVIYIVLIKFVVVIVKFDFIVIFCILLIFINSLLLWSNFFFLEVVDKI